MCALKVGHSDVAHSSCSVGVIYCQRTGFLYIFFYSCKFILADTLASGMPFVQHSSQFPVETVSQGGTGHEYSLAFTVANSNKCV